jgi:NodT family efflux transporter outer membrane factor (OMF) lipoprotein
MRSAVAILALASVALAACASGPRPKPDLRLPAGYEAPAGPPVGSIALDRWWTVFQDPQLDSLIESALAANPDATAAAAKLREARATRFTELYQFMPQGDANASGNHTQTTQFSGASINVPGFVIPGLSFSGPSENYSANFDVSWELDLFGRSIAATRAANADVAAARFDYEATRASLAAETADAYFQARGLAIQLADAEETARINRDLYELASKRGQAGLSPTSDADRTAGDLARAEAQVQGLKAELQAEKRTLLILAGRTYEPTASVDAPPDVGQPPAIPASLPSDLLRRRPDVRSAEAQVAGALGREDFARLAFLPTFTLKPGLGWSRTVEGGAELGLGTWSLGGAVAQPILSIPNLLAQLHVQNARTAEAVAAYEKTLQTAFREAEGALVRLDADRRQVAILADGEVRARRGYEATRLGYERGLVDLQTTLSAETSWRATRTQLTSAEVSAVRQAVAAFKAIGGGWSGAAAAQPTAQAGKPAKPVDAKG